MLPAFRSTRAAVLFGILLLILLLMPPILYVTGLPSREQAWSGVPQRAGDTGDVVRTIYDDRRSADVVFLGASLVRRGVDLERVQQAFSAHLGRPAEIESLSMNWPGADLQYFMLRDYLEHHHPTLIVWDMPGPASTWNEAHTQAYRWMRFGENKDVFAGLPLFFRVQAYGEMVLGAPRELLYRIRPNMLGPEEKADREGTDARSKIRTGYHDAAFVQDALPASDQSSAYLMPDTSSLLYVKGRGLNTFELKYLHAVISLARSKGCAVVLLHIPIDEEYGDTRIPQAADWARVLGPQYNMIGIPSATLFAGLGRNRFHHFYFDDHFNANGRTAFTEAVLHPIMEAFDEAR